MGLGDKMNRLLRAALALLVLCVAPAFAQDASDEDMEAALAFAVNNSTLILYHEMGHLFVGELGLPVLGKNEDAADSLAAVLLLDEDADWSDAVLRDSAEGWYLSPFNGDDVPGDWAFMDEHSLDKQRAFFFVCMMAGKNQEYYGELATEYGMDADRQDKCKGIFSQAHDSWTQLLAPHALSDENPAVGQIDIVYDDPGEYAAYAEALQADNFLEYAAGVITDNYAIPRNLTFRAMQCGVSNAYYSPGDAQITFCYEYTKHLTDLYLSAFASGSDGAGEDSGADETDETEQSQ
jgi:hypothetical protein